MDPLAIDHIIYAGPDLSRAVERFEQLTGFAVAPGGTHPKFGTRNGIVALEDSIYIEVIGPDPDRAAGVEPTLFGIGRLTEPCLVTWVARGRDLEAAAGAAAASGIELGAISDAAREQSHGPTLRWRLTDPFAEREGAVLPFLIDWGETPHPAETAPTQGKLMELRVRHPDPDTVRRGLTALGLEVDVAEGVSPSVEATLSTPRGTIDLT